MTNEERFFENVMREKEPTPRSDKGAGKGSVAWTFRLFATASTRPEPVFRRREGSRAD